MTSTLSLEPADTLPDLHIDFHVPADCPIEAKLYSADEVRIEVGALSLSLPRVALERLLEQGLEAKEGLELIARYPDPLPEI